MEIQKVSCSWKLECENYGTFCDKCKWNSDNVLRNYLSINTDKKTLKFLENNG